MSSIRGQQVDYVTNVATGKTVSAGEFLGTGKGSATAGELIDYSWVQSRSETVDAFEISVTVAKNATDNKVYAFWNQGNQNEVSASWVVKNVVKNKNYSISLDWHTHRTSAPCPTWASGGAVYGDRYTAYTFVDKAAGQKNPIDFFIVTRQPGHSVWGYSYNPYTTVEAADNAIRTGQMIDDILSGGW
jgi:hypothetical protein